MVAMRGLPRWRNCVNCEVGAGRYTGGGLDMMDRTMDGERNRGQWGGLAAKPGQRGAERSRSNRGHEFPRRHLHRLFGEGRPALFLAGLCGLVGVLLVPVALSLSLPFFAAGLGAIAVSVWMIGLTREVLVSGTTGADESARSRAGEGP